MPTATVTSKGQTTIPKEVRDYLGLHTGDRIDFLLADGEVILRPVTRDVRALKGLLSSAGKEPVSVEDMDAAVKRRFARVTP